MNLSSTDLDLTFDLTQQKVGMRFNAVAVPQGATITSAYIQFTTDETSSDADHPHRAGPGELTTPRPSAGSRTTSAGDRSPRLPSPGRRCRGRVIGAAGIGAADVGSLRPFLPRSLPARVGERTVAGDHHHRPRPPSRSFVRVLPGRRPGAASHLRRQHPGRDRPFSALGARLARAPERPAGSPSA